MSKTGNRNARIQVEISPAVEIGEGCAATVRDRQLRDQRDRLDSRRDELLLRFEERFRRGLKWSFDFSWHGLAC